MIQTVFSLVLSWHSNRKMWVEWHPCLIFNFRRCKKNILNIILFLWLPLYNFSRRKKSLKCKTLQQWNDTFSVYLYLTIVNILNSYIMLSCTYLYHFFWYLSIPCNAFIPCYIVCNGLNLWVRSNQLQEQTCVHCFSKLNLIITNLGWSHRS